MDLRFYKKFDNYTYIGKSQEDINNPNNVYNKEYEQYLYKTRQFGLLADYMSKYIANDEKIQIDRTNQINAYRRASISENLARQNATDTQQQALNFLTTFGIDTGNSGAKSVYDSENNNNYYSKFAVHKRKISEKFGTNNLHISIPRSTEFVNANGVSENIDLLQYVNNYINTISPNKKEFNINNPNKIEFDVDLTKIEDDSSLVALGNLLNSSYVKESDVFVNNKNIHYYNRKNVMPNSEAVNAFNNTDNLAFAFLYKNKILSEYGIFTEFTDIYDNALKSKQEFEDNLSKLNTTPDGNKKEYDSMTLSIRRLLPQTSRMNPADTNYSTVLNDELSRLKSAIIAYNPKDTPIYSSYGNENGDFTLREVHDDKQIESIREYVARNLTGKDLYELGREMFVNGTYGMYLYIPSNDSTAKTNNTSTDYVFNPKNLKKGFAVFIPGFMSDQIQKHFNNDTKKQAELALQDIKAYEGKYTTNSIDHTISYNANRGYTMSSADTNGLMVPISQEEALKIINTDNIKYNFTTQLALNYSSGDGTINEKAIKDAKKIAYSSALEVYGYYPLVTFDGKEISIDDALKGNYDRSNIHAKTQEVIDGMIDFYENFLNSITLYRKIN